MKIIFRITLALYFLLTTSYLTTAQIAINSDGSSPDASAMLDITSDSKGVLISRMTTAERTSISNPATGLLVYDTYEQSFWYYDGSEWIEITNSEYEPETTPPLSPAFISSVDIGSRPEDIEISGNYLYSLDRTDDAIYVYDISNPAAPTLASSLSISGTTFYEMAIDGNYLYAVSSIGTNDFYVVDISDPTNISLVGGYSIGSFLKNIVVNNGYAYVFDYAVSSSYVKIVDISTPSSPTQVGQYTVDVSNGGDSEALMIDGNYLYFGYKETSSSSNYLLIIDVSTPSSPTLVSNTSVPGSYGCNQLVKIDDYLYFGKNVGIQIIEVSTLSAPTSISGISGETDVFTISGDYLFADYTFNDYDMEIYDISATSSPSLLYSIDKSSTSTALDMMVVGDYLYSAEYDGNLYIYKIATQNTQLSDNWISNDGDDEGISIDADGNTTLSGSLTVGNYTFPTVDGSANQLLTTDGSGSLSWTDIDGNLGNHTATQNVILDDNWLSNDGGNEGIKITNDGYVGVGTTPTNGKFEVSGNGSSVTHGYGYLNSSGSVGTVSSNTKAYSIYADGRIACETYHAHSDKRIKNIQGISNSKDDLNTLMNIQITDYTMKDSISKGHQVTKKVIAQQVKSIYSQAVSTNTIEVIPNIYKTATIDKNGWVSFNPEVFPRSRDAAGQVGQLTMDNGQLKKGDKVQIIFDDKKELLEVLETKPNTFRVQPITNDHSPITIFVYGKQVDDFHTVDYEAISMLNVSATQQLAKENEQLKKRITALEKLEQEVNQLKAQVAKINELEAMLQQLQTQRSINTNSNSK